MALYDKASLVLIPSGTKEGVIFSQKPTNGDGDFTFSRSTAATRVNAEGLIEKETQNLLLQSNQFDTTWVTGATLTSGQSGYDGSNAWLMTNGNISQSITNTGVQTFSIYAKANTLDWIFMDFVGVSSEGAYFDIANGSIGTIGSNTIDAKIESVGGGWYRCSIVINTSSATGARLYTTNTNGSIGGSGSIYIQDAQLEQGLVARDYIETTTAAVEGGITDNVPRLDYTDSSCPALLLEPQRTNLLDYSEFFGSSTWVKQNATITSNYAISPEGVNNASRIVTSGTTFLYQLATFASGVEYTLSFYVKSNGSGNDDFRLYAEGTSTTKTATNEWVRHEYTFTGQGSVKDFGLRDIGGSTIDILIWGAQIEAGSYATSYIPTYGTSVTRNQDLSLTASPSTSYFGQTEGTIFTEIKINAITSGSYSRVFNLKNSGGSNQIYFQQNDSRINGTVFNGSNQFTQNTSSGFLSVGSTYKMAMAYKDGDYALYINGTQIGTSSASGLGTLAVDRVDLTTLSGNINLGNEVKQSLVFNTRLSNEELEALTQV